MKRTRASVHPGVRMLCLLGSITLTVACDSTPAVVDERVLTVGPAVQTAELLALRTETLEDTLGFAGATDIRSIPDGYAVVDGRLNRLALLDSGLEVRKVLGRTGAGPGEMRFPLYLSSAPGELAIWEAGNRRVSVFDAITLEPQWTKRFRRTGEFALLPGERLLLISPDSSMVGVIVTEDDSFLPLEPFPPLPRLAPLTDTRQAPKRVTDVVNDLAYVVDEHRGAIGVYDTRDGSLVDTMLFPSDLWQPLLDEIGETMEVWRKAGTPLVGGNFGLKRLVRAGPDRLLFLIGWDPAYAFYIDTERRTIHEVLPPDDPVAEEALAHGSTAMMHGDTLVVVSQMNIIKVRLDLPS